MTVTEIAAPILSDLGIRPTEIISASNDGTVAIYSCTTCQPFNDVLTMAGQQDRNRG
jgi:hypothetical protein